jgi:hypothetical protein
MTSANDELSADRLDQVSGGTWEHPAWWLARYAAQRLERAIAAQVKTTVNGSTGHFPKLP